MKKIIALSMFLSVSAFASSVTIQPGSSITLSADTTTTVTCQSDGNQGGRPSNAACYCKGIGGDLYNAILALNGETITLGAQLWGRENCLSILNSTPACK